MFQVSYTTTSNDYYCYCAVQTLEIVFFFFQNKNIDPEYRGQGGDDEHYAFSVAEAIFVGWFTFEYIIRFIAAPQKWR